MITAGPVGSASGLGTLGSQAGWDVLAFAVGALLTVAIAWGRSFLVSRTPARRMWRYASGGDLLIIVSSSATVDTGKYQRPVTGIGQVRALALLAPHLVRAYRDFDLQRVQLAEEARGEDLDRDLLILGGPKTNRFAASLLTDLAAVLPFTVADTVIVWNGTSYDGDPGAADRPHDYGYVVRAANPNRAGRRVVIVGGSHTYGTVAAARWLATRGGSADLAADIAVLVRAEVKMSGHVPDPRVLESADLVLRAAAPAEGVAT